MFTPETELNGAASAERALNGANGGETPEATTDAAELVTVDLVRRHLRGRLEREEGISQNSIARRLGIAPSTFSAWCDGTIEGVRSNVGEKVGGWLAEQRYAAGPNAYIETPSAVRMFSALEHAHQKCDMVAISGGPGVGKTTVARHFVSEWPRTWRVTLSPATSGLIPALEAIARAMGIKEPISGAARISDAIERRAGEYKGLILLDECQHLSMAAVEQVRAIHDETTVGVALVGNELSYTRFLGGPRVANYAQIRSRLGLKVAIGRPTQEDVAAILTAWGCTDPTCLEPLVEAATRPGALRNVEKVLRWCVEGGKKITRSSVLAACGLVGGV